MLFRSWGLYGFGSGSFRAFNYITAPQIYVGTGLATASFPGDLLGRQFSSYPVNIDGYTSVSATSGPTYGGESWTIQADYQHGPSRMFPSVSGSPRDAFWLDNTVSNDLIFDLHGDGTEETGLLGRPLALAILGTNVTSATLSGWNGTAWVGVSYWSAALSTGATWARQGRILTITSGGTLFYAVRNQLAGCWVDLGGGKQRKIVGNSEGLVGSSSGVVAAIQLADVDGTEGTSGTGTLYTNQAVGVVAQPSTYRRFKLSFPIASTPEGYYVVGTVLLGSLAILARRPSNGREIARDFQAQTSRPPGGPRSWRALGPPLKKWSITFGELLPSSQLYGASPSPDYVALSTAGSASSALHAAAASALGLVEELNGEYVLYVGCIPQATSNVTTTMITDPNQIAFGRIVEPGSLTIVRGQERSSEVYTVNGMILETEP